MFAKKYVRSNRNTVHMKINILLTSDVVSFLTSGPKTLELGGLLIVGLFFTFLLKYICQNTSAPDKKG